MTQEEMVARYTALLIARETALQEEWNRREALMDPIEREFRRKIANLDRAFQKKYIFQPNDAVFDAEYGAYDDEKTKVAQEKFEAEKPIQEAHTREWAAIMARYLVDVTFLDEQFRKEYA